MTLNIQTYSNVKGGSAFFKAVGHPLVRTKARALLSQLKNSNSVDIYDPYSHSESFASLYDLSGIQVENVYVQDWEDINAIVLGHRSKPITSIANSTAETVLVMAFDAERTIAQIKHLLPSEITILSLDRIRLDDQFIAIRNPYLSKLNFATNYAFFRDRKGQHTRITTANYWSNFGAKDVTVLFCLFGEDGSLLAQWQEQLKNSTVPIVIDSSDIRKKYNLGPFIGQLFIHVIAGSGHDIVKYALDTYSDETGIISTTHDANAWPADLYAGIPAPSKGERVILWIQNSHPCPIPSGDILFNQMGQNNSVSLKAEIGPFATYGVNMTEMLPNVSWPSQFEVHAGKYFVRPRYEVESRLTNTRIAHANVERRDLKPDPKIPNLSGLMGKNYLLPAPILPINRYHSFALPTPMSTVQVDLPVAISLYDASGKELLCQPLGCLPRDHSRLCDVGQILRENLIESLISGYGHMELTYNFDYGGSADGWLHALFRYVDKKSGHSADTSFGAHIFNTILTYRNEPQSYSGLPPGLSTKLYLRTGQKGVETICHLIYPTSTNWHKKSCTDLILFGTGGMEVARKKISIPCGGSLLWSYFEAFDKAERQEAGEQAYLIIRDTTCRLFGYHGLVHGDKGFSLDHMFGF